MRVVAIVINMEIIFFSPKYSTHLMGQNLDQYQQTSRPISQVTHYPILEVQGWELPHGTQKAPLISQSGSWDARLDGCHAISVATSWPGTFRGKATNLVPPSLYINVSISLDMCGSSGSFSFAPNMNPRITRYSTQWKNNIWEGKIPSSQKDCVLKIRKQCGRRQHENPFTWEGTV